MIRSAMFVRLETVRGNGRTYRYLQIVENRRENGRVRQHIVASPCSGQGGAARGLLASGDLDQVIRQLVTHCPTVELLEARATRTFEATSDEVWGPVLVLRAPVVRTRPAEPPAPARGESAQGGGLSMAPMIDVTFLLLVFFLCSVRFKVLEGKLDTFLPKQGGTEATASEELR
jgi:hypothetical protein